MSYQETVDKWNSQIHNKAAIHPAGSKGDVAFWDSGIYDANRILGLSHQYNISPLKAEYLDYGCGVGRVSIPLAANTKRVIGYDSSPRAIYGEIESNFDALPENFVAINNILPEIQADIAFSISVFIHHTLNDGARMLKEMASMVRPGGYLFVQIPIYDKAREPKHWTDVAVWDIGWFNIAASAAVCECIDIKTNPGEFSFSKIGPNHHEFQILRKYEDAD